MENPNPTSRPRRSPEVWEAARRDYAAGCSSAVIAERYGLNARSVRRKAVLEGWRQGDPAQNGYARLRDRFRHDLAETPEFADIERVNQEDMFDLLFLPDVASLQGFAFRRAASCAAMDGPAEAAAWLRVARLASQLDGQIVEVQPFGPADYMRAQMLHVPRAPAGERDPTDGGPESDMSAMTAEIRGRTDSAG